MMRLGLNDIHPLGTAEEEGMVALDTGDKHL